MRDIPSTKLQIPSDTFELIELDTDDFDELKHAYEVIQQVCEEMNSDGSIRKAVTSRRVMH